MAAAYDPPVSDDRGPLVIRPSWRAIGLWQLPVSAIAGLGLLGGSIKLFGRSERLTWFAVLLGICGLGLTLYVAYFLAYVAGTRITITAQAILVTHRFRSTSTIDPRSIARVVRCSVVIPYGRAPKVPQAVVFAFSASGRCVMSLYATRWNQDDLDRIWSYLGVVPEGAWSDVISDPDLGTRFPGAF
jgi:hypothetical protein